MSTTNWDTFNGYYIYTYDVGIEQESKEKTTDMYHTHELLQLLGALKVIEYSRGYDGLYYDVCIRVKDEQ